MPRRALTEDEQKERKERKRLKEQARKKRLKSDPASREELLRKDRERYARKKAAGLVVKRSQLPPKKLRNVRQKNLVGALAYYKRKKSNKASRVKQSTVIDNTETAGPSTKTINVTSAKQPIDTDEDRLSITPRRSLRFKSPKLEKRRPKNLRIDTLLAKSSSFITSSPKQAPPGSPQLAPSVSSINSPDSTLCPNSPASDSSYASIKCQHDLQKRFRKYQRTKFLQIKKLEQKLMQVTNERNLYKKRYERLIQKPKERICAIKKTKPNLKTKPKQDRTRQIVVQFYEDDENSSLCPGKNDSITKNGLKKQKRLLTNNIKNLHKKYLESGYPPVSYVTFSRMKPFWVQQPKINMRNTCLCEKHENMELLVTALKANRIIVENSITDVLKSICCDILSVNCLQKTCNICKNKYLNYQEFDNLQNVYYWAWEKKKNTYYKNGIEKTAINVEKVRHAVKPLELIKKFDTCLKPFLNHCANIRNQTDAIKILKQNLTDNDCIIHIDFSENYNAKYSSEIQSVHFGGSRKQFTLHTAVLYFKINNHLSKTQCFCTISSCLRHDAAAVWAHLVPIFREIENTVPTVRNLYIISDSPSAQYRNKKIFYIMSQFVSYIPTLNNVVWNYCECGHGKGAPDGVGGVLKRSADQYVAFSGDIPDINSLVTALESSVQGVKIETVNDYEVTEKDWLLPSNLKPFRGTMQVHQVIWSKDLETQVALRKLSCTHAQCLSNATKPCPHGKHLGFYDFSTSLQSLPKPTLRSRTTHAKKSTAERISSLRSVKLTDKLNLFTKPSTSTAFILPSDTSIVLDQNLPSGLNDSDIIPSCSLLDNADSEILNDLEKSDIVDRVQPKKNILECSDSDESIFDTNIKTKIEFITVNNKDDDQTLAFRPRKILNFSESDSDDDC